MKKSRCRQFLFLVLTIIVLPAFLVSGESKLPNDILWVKASDAYKCCVHQTYTHAMDRLKKRAGGKEPGSWCVVLDADETVISNVPFQVQLAVSGEKFSSGLWNAWCEKSESKALPGAREFCSLAKELGGKVIIITNRKEPPTRNATVKNLETEGIPFDAVLLREGPYVRDRSKTMRREAVEKGTVQTLPKGMDLPPLEILMRVGDQTHDLYDDKKFGFEDVGGRFAEDLVIIPNPMYGSWERSKPAATKGAAEKSAVHASASGVKAGVAIGWKDAMARAGEQVVVEDRVVKVYVPDHGPAKLNFGTPWWESLTVVVFTPEAFGDLKRKFEGKTIRVSGDISTFTDREGRKTVQIKVSDPSQIEVVR